MEMKLGIANPQAMGVPGGKEDSAVVGREGPGRKTMARQTWNLVAHTDVYAHKAPHRGQIAMQMSIVIMTTGGLG